MSPDLSPPNLEEVEPDSPAPRLRKNALARFISNAALVATGLLSATVTARWLGPSGKGTLSTMLYIVALSSLVASLGVGDAVIVLAAGDRTRLQSLISSSLLPVLLASVPAMGFILVAAWLGNWSGISLAVAAACVLVPLRMLNHTLINFQNATERLVRSSLISVAQVFIEVVLLVVLVAAADLDIFGAVLAAIAGAGAAIWLSTRALRQDGFSLRLKWKTDDARPVLALGASLISSQIVINLAQRFDLLLVYTIRGEAKAGLYAIALTLGQLAAYTAGSLAIAAFPRLAIIEDEHAWKLIPRLARMALTSALLSAAFLAAVVPFLIPVLFGRAFAGAVVPTLILLLGGVAWSELSILTRSVAALGHPIVQLNAFLGYLGVMCLLDLFLIPRWGITGAAIASVVSPVLAIIGFWVWYRKVPASEPLGSFVPHREDLRELVAFIRETSKRAVGLLRDPATAWKA